MSFRNGIAIITCLLIHTNFIFGQKATGIVFNSDSKKPIPYVNITNLSIDKSIISDFNGKFQIEAKLNDSLIISSMGYHKIVEVIHSFDPLNILLPPQSYFLNEVKVLSEEEVPFTYKSVVFPDGDPNLGNAIVNPLSYWYYKLSKKEKAKRKIRNLLDYEKCMAKAMKIYNKKLVAEYTGLSGTELDSCYIFCNANIELVEEDTDFTIKFKLLKILSDYNQTKK
ncbi:MAG: carboxypeptidase-like regulatory domain-containing protein [Salinivirgaceae bacterium]|nr:carboxypeptidase-like regulatory domain-containing protein [Salinivirgaceae bacterium]